MTKKSKTELVTLEKLVVESMNEKKNNLTDWLRLFILLKKHKQ